MNIYADLFLTFAKVGCFTFGGGYAMISIIEDACVEKKKWITHDDMMNITVVAESTPGPIAINCSTFVGYRQAGLPGALAATFGMVLPSFLIIFAISSFLDNFLEITVIAKAFQGIKIAVGILITEAGINMYKKMRNKQKKMQNSMQGKAKKKKLFSTAIITGSFLVMFAVNVFSLRISSITLMLAAALLGLAVSFAGNAGKESGVQG